MSEWDDKAGLRLCRALRPFGVGRPGTGGFWNQISQCVGGSTPVCPPCEEGQAEATWFAIYEVAEDMAVGLMIAVLAGIVLRVLPFGWVLPILQLVAPRAINTIKAIARTQAIAESAAGQGIGSGIFQNLIGGAKKVVRDIVAESNPEFAALLTKAR